MDIEQTYAALEEGTYLASDDSYYQRRSSHVSNVVWASQIPITLLNLPAFHFHHLSLCAISIYPVLEVPLSKILKIMGLIMSWLNYSLKQNGLTMIYPFFLQYHTHSIKILFD